VFRGIQTTSNGETVMAQKDTFLDDGLRGWLSNTARKEHWRMALWYSLDDLEQDGYLCYMKCVRAYPQISGIENPTHGERKWFMALVQTAYRNHIMTLAGKFAIGKEETVPDVASTDERGGSLEELMPPASEVASILLTLKNAPAEIRDAIDKLLQDGLDGGEYLRSQLYRDGTRLRRSRRPRRETTKDYFERVTGVVDLPNKLREYLFGEPDSIDRLVQCLFRSN